MYIFISIFIFMLGIVVGYLIEMMLVRKRVATGSIFVSHQDEKTIYSLELDSDPSIISSYKYVLFEVKNLDIEKQRLDRK